MAVEPGPVSTQDFNDKVSVWGSSVAQQLKMSIRTLTSKGKGELVKSLRLKTKKYYGEIDRVTYRFWRHGVFLHKGVGRGYKMEGGAVMRAGLVERKSQLSQGRKPVEWFNPVLDKRVPKLADMVAEMRADQAVRATKMA